MVTGTRESVVLTTSRNIRNDGRRANAEAALPSNAVSRASVELSGPGSVARPA